MRVQVGSWFRVLSKLRTRFPGKSPKLLPSPGFNRPSTVYSVIDGNYWLHGPVDESSASEHRTANASASRATECLGNASATPLPDDDSSGRDLDWIDRGLSRPCPLDHAESSVHERFLSPRRPFPMDHPHGGRLSRARAGNGTCRHRVLAPPDGSPWAGSWEFCHSSASSTCAHGYPWNFGRRCSCRGGSLSNRPGWPPAAASRFSGSCDRTTPLLVGAVLAIAARKLWRPGMVGIPGSDNLAAPSRRCPECALDRLGHRTDRQPEPSRLRAKDVAQP